MNTQTKNNTYCQFWMKTGNYSSAFFFMSQNALRLMLHIFIYRHNFFTAFLIKKVHTIYDLYELSFDKWYVSIRNCYASAVQVLVIVELMKQPCLQFTEQALAYILCKPWDWKKKKKSHDNPPFSLFHSLQQGLGTTGLVPVVFIYQA